MIEVTTGDILAADAEALVNTVNCVGIMGRGIALQFRKAFPEQLQGVRRRHARRKQLHPGKYVCFLERASLTNPRYIINFPNEAALEGERAGSPILNRGSRLS